jgi:hypothetical protein
MLYNKRKWGQESVIILKWNKNYLMNKSCKTNLSQTKNIYKKQNNYCGKNKIKTIKNCSRSYLKKN